MEIEVAHVDSHKQYIDVDNLIYAKDNEIVAIHINLNKNNIGRLIGSLLGLSGGELDCFTVIYPIILKEYKRICTKSYIVNIIVTKLHISVRTANRYITGLLDKKIIFYNVDNSAIIIHPKYCANINNIKIISLII